MKVYRHKIIVSPGFLIDWDFFMFKNKVKKVVIIARIW